jgi:hypothetical protein
MVGAREKLFRRSSLGSPHLVVGALEKLFRRSSLGAAVCNFGSSYTRKLAESRA